MQFYSRYSRAMETISEVNEGDVIPEFESESVLLKEPAPQIFVQEIDRSGNVRPLNWSVRTEWRHNPKSIPISAPFIRAAVELPAHVNQLDMQRLEGATFRLRKQETNPASGGLREVFVVDIYRPNAIANLVLRERTGKLFEIGILFAGDIQKTVTVEDPVCPKVRIAVDHDDRGLMSAAYRCYRTASEWVVDYAHSEEGLLQTGESLFPPRQIGKYAYRFRIPRDELKRKMAGWNRSQKRFELAKVSVLNEDRFALEETTLYYVPPTPPPVVGVKATPTPTPSPTPVPTPKPTPPPKKKPKKPSYWDRVKIGVGLGPTLMYYQEPFWGVTDFREVAMTGKVSATLPIWKRLDLMLNTFMNLFSVVAPQDGYEFIRSYGINGRLNYILPISWFRGTWSIAEGLYFWGMLVKDNKYGVKMLASHQLFLTFRKGSEKERSWYIYFKYAPISYTLKVFSTQDFEIASGVGYQISPLYWKYPLFLTFDWAKVQAQIPGKKTLRDVGMTTYSLGLQMTF